MNCGKCKHWERNFPFAWGKCKVEQVVDKVLWPGVELPEECPSFEQKQKEAK